MHRTKYILDHAFYCTQCGRRGIPIARKRCREEGHLKRLYCVHCERVVNHVECVPNSKYDENTFMEEFTSGNFDEDGMRRIPLSQWKQERNKALVLSEESRLDNVEITDWFSIFGIDADEDAQAE